MIVPGVNLLVYAYNLDAPEHNAALMWWEGLLDGTESVGLPWAVSIGFVRVISNPIVIGSPVSTLAAVDQVHRWLSYKHVEAIDPGANHLELLRRNLAIPYAGTNLVAYAHIAALATEYDAELHSRDAGFARFPGVRWHNPLA